MPFTRFDRYVDRHARSFTERLQALCRMPSVAARGTGMRAVSEAVEQMLQRVGAGTRVFKMGSGYPIIYGECGAGERCFVVYGHYDVQPIGQLSEWSSGPFAAAITDGKLYARGAANSKGNLVARVAAVEAYQKTFGKLPVCLRFVVEGEAGIGSNSLYRFTEEQGEMLRADGCIWEEGYKDTQNASSSASASRVSCFLSARFRRARGFTLNGAASCRTRVAHRAGALDRRLAERRLTIDGFTSHVAPSRRMTRQALKTVENRRGGLAPRVSHQQLGARDVWQGVDEGTHLRPDCTICGIHTGHTEAGAKTVSPARRSRVSTSACHRPHAELVVQCSAHIRHARLSRRGSSNRQRALRQSSLNSIVARAARPNPPPSYGADAVVYPLDPASVPVGRGLRREHAADRRSSPSASATPLEPARPDENSGSTISVAVKYSGASCAPRQSE